GEVRRAVPAPRFFAPLPRGAGQGARAGAVYAEILRLHLLRGGSVQEKAEEEKACGGVGLSNILDSELIRRKPAKRSHGEVVGTAIMDSELPGEVIQGVKAAAGVKAFLILAVAALHFTVVARRIGPDEL